MAFLFRQLSWQLPGESAIWISVNRRRGASVERSKQGTALAMSIPEEIGIAAGGFSKKLQRVKTWGGSRRKRVAEYPGFEPGTVVVLGSPVDFSGTTC